MPFCFLHIKTIIALNDWKLLFLNIDLTVFIYQIKQPPSFHYIIFFAKFYSVSQVFNRITSTRVCICSKIRLKFLSYIFCELFLPESFSFQKWFELKLFLRRLFWLSFWFHDLCCFLYLLDQDFCSKLFWRRGVLSFSQRTNCCYRTELAQQLYFNERSSKSQKGMLSNQLRSYLIYILHIHGEL